MNKKIKISIIVDNDHVWNLPAWENTIPILIKNKFDISSIIVCEEKLVHLSGLKKLQWYFFTFGFWNFLKLSIYASIILCKRKLKYLLRKNQNKDFFDLAKKVKCKYYQCCSPNEKKILKLLINSKVDIILLMTSHVLKKNIIKIPSIGIINKHASALPANKGLFPYFWSIINQNKQGISFHKVNTSIDQGKLLYQKLNIPKEKLKSMVSFYIYVFNSYPVFVVKAIKNLLNKKYLNYKTNLKSSYFSLPSTKDYNTFIKKDGKIINLSDILYCISKM